MRAACVASGGRVRLECSGVCFLRSICRLTHRGHAQYVKGDGDAFGDFLELLLRFKLFITMGLVHY
jgi:hypothetical protein